MERSRGSLDGRPASPEGLCRDTREREGFRVAGSGEPKERRFAILAEGGGPEGGDTFEVGPTAARSERGARTALSDEGVVVNRPGDLPPAVVPSAQARRHYGVASQRSR